MQTPPTANAAPPRGATDLWLWAALATAFSPTGIDLVRHLGTQPTARYALVFVALFVLLAARERPVTRARGFGFALIAIGLCVELIAVLANEIRFARPGLAVAAIGTARVTGTASLRTSLLLLFAIPFPTAIQRRFSPQLEGAQLELLSPLVPAGEVELALEGSRVGELALGTPDGGLPLCALVAGLAFAWAIQRRRALPAACGFTAIGLVGLPLQSLALAAALALLAAGFAAGGRLLLDWVWLAVAIAAIVGLRIGLPAHETPTAAVES